MNNQSQLFRNEYVRRIGRVSRAHMGMTLIEVIVYAGLLAVLMSTIVSVVARAYQDNLHLQDSINDAYSHDN